MSAKRGKLLSAFEVRELLRLHCRNRFNNSQKEMSIAIGISPQFLGDVLRGTREPSGKILVYLKVARQVLYELLDL